MPLNWDLAKVENWNDLFTTEENGNRRMIFKNERIVMHTMAIGVRSITEKNWEKFYGRVQMWERIKGAGYYTHEGHQPIYTTQDDVKRMIGLETNASEFSKTEFLKRLSWGLDI
jgi:hypothetical protein